MAAPILSDAVCGNVGRRSGAAADGKSGADEFAAGDGGIPAGGIYGAAEAGGVAEDAKEIVVADSEEERDRGEGREGSKEMKEKV